MTTQSITLDSLRARVEALGYKLLENDEAEHERGYYVQLRDGMIDAASAGSTPKGIAEWLGETELARVDARKLATAPMTVAEYVESELGNVKDIVSEILQLAHECEEPQDPGVIMSIVKRLATEAHEVLYGRCWDELTDALRNPSSVQGGAS